MSRSHQPGITSILNPLIHPPTLLFSILSFQILVEDLFGMPAEEREVGESVAKIPESKSPQSYNSYCLVAQFLSPDQVPQLLAPVKEVRGSIKSGWKLCKTFFS